MELEGLKLNPLYYCRNTDIKKVTNKLQCHHYFYRSAEIQNMVYFSIHILKYSLAGDTSLRRAEFRGFGK